MSHDVFLEGNAYGEGGGLEARGGGAEITHSSTVQDMCYLQQIIQWRAHTDIFVLLVSVFFFYNETIKQKQQHEDLAVGDREKDVRDESIEIYMCVHR